MDLQEKIDNLAHLAKCKLVYDRVEKFILDNGKKSGDTLELDIESLSQKDCFNLGHVIDFSLKCLRKR